MLLLHQLPCPLQPKGHLDVQHELRLPVPPLLPRKEHVQTGLNGPEGPNSMDSESKPPPSGGGRVSEVNMPKLDAYKRFAHAMLIKQTGFRARARRLGMRDARHRLAYSSGASFLIFRCIADQGLRQQNDTCG